METTTEIQKPQMKIAQWASEQAPKIDRIMTLTLFLPSQVEQIWVEPVATEAKREVIGEKLDELLILMSNLETDLICVNEVQKTAVAKRRQAPLTFDVNGEPVELED